MCSNPPITLACQTSGKETTAVDSDDDAFPAIGINCRDAECVIPPYTEQSGDCLESLHECFASRFARTLTASKTSRDRHQLGSTVSPFAQRQSYEKARYVDACLANLLSMHRGGTSELAKLPDYCKRVRKLFCKYTYRCRRP